MVIKDLLHHMQQANRLHELCNQVGDLEMDIFAAVNSFKDLFHDSKGSSILIVDSELQSKFMDATRKIGALTQNLFESVRLQGGQCQDDDRKRFAKNLASYKGGCSSTLVGAATLAQRERVEKGRTSNGGPMYRKYPTWAKGLISAAKVVTSSTSQLLSLVNLILIVYHNINLQMLQRVYKMLQTYAAKVASEEEIDFDELSATGFKVK
ncbi:hypothetical protein DICPUDRAFT_81926 [Dictyostelium purpureum]|uniref:I/LWEQ domain-containing protein n=1 Tax=Dictyostelium purpureum TaxID=5786 RepID=F0ZV02_DICPU|nr:uncharacterized protein DICPUDRAFT_81926 [Dictyostelium purpureum]EGC32220.1 hypothetical protein DICPUDRAFT_81926 [Dictyostelium purpureum]|eukprot:XP_003291256.1 hypothetical protein DICPUDRAFT_81926 [Dictyostelium purpureum]